MRYFHRASIDGLRQTGFTLFSGVVDDEIDSIQFLPDLGSHVETQIVIHRKGGRFIRFLGVGLLIVIPTPFMRTFLIDYGTKHILSRVDYWLCIEIAGYRHSRIAYGAKPKKSAA